MARGKCSANGANPPASGKERNGYDFSQREAAKLSGPVEANLEDAFIKFMHASDELNHAVASLSDALDNRKVIRIHSKNKSHAGPAPVPVSKRRTRGAAQ